MNHNCKNCIWDCKSDESCDDFSPSDNTKQQELEYLSDLRERAREYNKVIKEYED